MFQIGFGEVLVVLIVAIWVLGPEKLPVVARVCGRWLARAKSSYLTIKNEFAEELRVQETLRAAATKAAEESHSKPADPHA